MLAGFSRQSSVQLCHSLHCGPHYRTPLAFGSSTSLFRVVTLCSQPYTQEDLGNTILLGLLGSVIDPVAPKTTDAFHSPAPSARARGKAFPSATHTNYTRLPMETSRLIHRRDQRSQEKTGRPTGSHPHKHSTGNRVVLSKIAFKMTSPWAEVRWWAFIA